MRLKYQLFLTLLLASALLIAAMAGFGRWSFDRGFLDYVNEVERQRLDPLAEALAAGHARNGSWSWVTGTDHRTWKALLDRHLPRRRRGPPPAPAAEPRPAPRTDDPRAPATANGAPPLPRTDPAGRRDASRAPLLTLDPRLLLADADRRPLIGRVEPDRPVRWLPIESGDDVVGYLGYRAVQSPPAGIDQSFAARQRRGFLYAALAMVLLSAGLAIVIAARLVRPLLGVADAVERIGQGDYAHRVNVARRDEIGDLARDINRLGATLETSLAARRRWLAEISHELRTPVAILRGELEAIQDGVQPLDQAAVSSLHAESLRLGRLIDDLHALTLSDAGALDYRFDALELREVLAERLDVGRGGAAEAGIVVELHSGALPLIVRADRQRIGQLVDNLLQNSLRYTDPGGTLRITLGRAAGRAIIEWSDSAPGVDAEHLPQLFEPLYRVDAARHRDHGGAGLGLAIAARIVEAHDGTIAARPSALGGLTIHVELPLVTRSAE